jgi:hypothetical protein
MRTINFKTEYFIILLSIVIKLAFQIIATANSGYHGDELLHIEAGKHLAFGYMDFPPFIGFVSWIQNLFHSDSLFINHLGNYINSALIILISGLIVLRLGGSLLAVLLTESAILFSPGFSASQYLFLPTAFEQIFWLLFLYYTIEYSKSENSKFILFIALIASVGFLNKYSILFLFAGFIVSILLFKRELLSKRVTWFALLLFGLFMLPNIFWQISNQFPIFHHVSELYETQLDKQSFLKEFITLILFLNPLTLLLWLPAMIVVPFNTKFKAFQLPVFTLIFSCIFLIFSKGKSYYFFPIILSLIPFGSVYFEQLIKQRNWIGYIYLFILITFGAYLLPHGIPLLKLEKYIESYHVKPNEDGKTPLVFENFYSKQNWVKILDSVNKKYQELSEEDRKHCYVWGRHYSMAGGINLLGSKYNLPQAFSFHSSFYSWVPDFDKNVVVISISESNLKKSYWEQYFNKVEEIEIIDNPFASEKNWYNYRIFLCRELKYNSHELKQIFKNQIF